MEGGKITIAYWGIKGRGQVLRELAEFTGLPYENKFYTDPSEWFGKDKAALKTDFPNLPYILDGETVVTESEACALYIVQKSKKLELLGSNAEEIVNITQVKGVLNDAVNNLFKVAMNKEGDVAKGIQDTVIPKLTLLAKYLGKKEWLVGKLTLVDFFFIQILKLLALNGDYVQQLNLTDYVKRYDELPALKAYFASDRCVKGPYFPPTYVNANFKVL